MTRNNNALLSILAISSLVLGVHTILFTSINGIDIGDLGLVNLMPPSFWAGIILIFPIIYFGRESKSMIISGLILTALYLYVIPFLVRNPVWLSNSYYPFGEGVLISKQGHLVKSSDKILTSYQDWPIFLYLTSVILLITDIPQAFILKAFPLFFVAIYASIIFLLLRQKFESTYSLIGSIWFLASFWIRQYYFGPPGLSYVYLLLIIYTIFKIYFYQDSISTTDKRGALSFISVLLYFTLTATHLLTTFFALLFLSSIYLLDRYYRKIVLTNIKTLNMIFIVILVSYNTLSVQNILVKIIFREIFLAEPFRIYQESGRIIGTTDMLINYFSTWAIIIINGLVALLMIIRIRTERVRDHQNVLYLVFLFLIGIFAVVGRYGSHEAYQRAFMFGLIPLSYLSLESLQNQKKALVLIISTLILLNIPAQYGADAFRLASDPQLEGSKYFAEKVPENIDVLTKFTLYFRYYAPEKQVRIVRYGDFPFTSNIISSEIEGALENSDYYVDSILLSKFYDYYLGEDPLDNVETYSFDRVYDNPEYTIYKTSPIR